MRRTILDPGWAALEPGQELFRVETKVTEDPDGWRWETRVSCDAVDNWGLVASGLGVTRQEAREQAAQAHKDYADHVEEALRISGCLVERRDD